jgi:endonuclease III
MIGHRVIIEFETADLANRFTLALEQDLIKSTNNSVFDDYNLRNTIAEYGTRKTKAENIVKIVNDEVPELEAKVETAL